MCTGGWYVQHVPMYFPQYYCMSYITSVVPMGMADWCQVQPLYRNWRWLWCRKAESHAQHMPVLQEHEPKETLPAEGGSLDFERKSDVEQEELDSATKSHLSVRPHDATVQDVTPALKLNSEDPGKRCNCKHRIISSSHLNHSLLNVCR